MLEMVVTTEKGPLLLLSFLVQIKKHLIPEHMEMGITVPKGFSTMLLQLLGTTVTNKIR